MIFLGVNETDEAFDYSCADEMHPAVQAVGMQDFWEIEMTLTNGNTANLMVASCSKNHGHKMLGAVVEVMGTL